MHDGEGIGGLKKNVPIIILLTLLVVSNICWLIFTNFTTSQAEKSVMILHHENEILKKENQLWKRISR